MFGALALKASGTVMPAEATLPLLVQQASTGGAAAGTSATGTLDAAPTAGNTLLMAVREFVSGDAITPAGWTLLGEQLPAGSTRPAAFFEKTSDGTETLVTVNFSNSAGHGIAIQEWQGAVTFGTTSGKYIASGITNPQTMGPTDAPPSASAVPSMFLFFDNIGTNQAYWPAGWTGTSKSLTFAHNDCEIGAMNSAPGAAVSPSISFNSAPGSYMYWWNIWVSKP